MLRSCGSILSLASFFATACATPDDARRAAPKGTPTATAGPAVVILVTTGDDAGRARAQPWMRVAALMLNPELHAPQIAEPNAPCATLDCLGATSTLSASRTLAVTSSAPGRLTLHGREANATPWIQRDLAVTEPGPAGQALHRALTDLFGPSAVLPRGEVTVESMEPSLEKLNHAWTKCPSRKSPVNIAFRLSPEGQAESSLLWPAATPPEIQRCLIEIVQAAVYPSPLEGYDWIVLEVRFK